MKKKLQGHELPPLDWKTYMLYFGSWCGSFGTDVLISFVHEAEEGENQAYVSSIRFEICNNWNFLKDNADQIEKDSTNMIDDQNDDFKFTESQKIVYLWGLKKKWNRKNESKAILAKALFSNLHSAVPFISISTLLKKIKNFTFCDYNDFDKLSKCFKYHGYALIGQIKDPNNKLPYLSIDAKLHIKLFRGLLSRSVNNTLSLLEGILKKIWRATEWQEQFQKLEVQELHIYSKQRIQLIYTNLNRNNNDEATLNFFNSTKTENLLNNSVEASLYMEFPSFHFKNADTKVFFILKDHNFLKIKVYVGLLPDISWSTNFDDRLDKNKIKSIIQKDDLINTEKKTIHKGIGNATGETNIGCFYIYCKYEGGYVDEKMISQTLTDLALSILINYLYSDIAIYNLVTYNVNIGDQSTQNFYAGLAVPFDINETTFERCNKIKESFAY